jgi:DUF4097 and DUF4098 domain-containing protein YvlB
MSALLPRRVLGLLSATAVVVAASACVDVVAGVDGLRYVTQEEKRFSISGKPELTLSTFDGAIEVRPWDRPEVRVVVEKHAATKEAADRIEVNSEQNGNQIAVTARAYPQRTLGIGFHVSRSAKLIVSVPASSDVQARSGDGSVDVEGISGRLQFRSGDGSIRGRRLSGDVNVHTGDGSIRLNDVDGRLDALTGDGSIVVDGRLTEVRVRTGDGSVAVSASGGSAPAGDWDIVTGDGSVTMEIPDGFNGDLDAHTGDGAIVMHDITLSNVTGRIGRRNIRGQLGSGGRPIHIRTGDGSITLRRR